MGKKLCWIFLTAILLLGVSAANVGKASSLPIIRIEPKNNTAEPGQTFIVNITVTGITQNLSLYGWSATITFNPQIINGVNASNGPFLGTSGYEVMWLTPQINNTKGEARVGALLKPTPTGFPPNGASGNGVLSSIVFKAVSRGTTSLHFDFADLYNVIGDYNVYLDHTVEDGSFSNGGELPLQLIASVLVVVAVGVGVAVFLYRRKRGV